MRWTKIVFLAVVLGAKQAKFAHLMELKKTPRTRGLHSTCFSPSSPGFDSQRSQKKSEEKLSMLLWIFNGAGDRKVDGGLKMLIKPIWFWLVARRNPDNSLVFLGFLLSIPNFRNFARMSPHRMGSRSFPEWAARWTRSRWSRGTGRRRGWCGRSAASSGPSSWAWKFGSGIRNSSLTVKPWTSASWLSRRQDYQTKYLKRWLDGVLRWLSIVEKSTKAEQRGKKSSTEW